MNRSGKALWVATLTFAFVASAIAVVPARADTKSFTLYGGMSTGWGFSSASQLNPGPTIIVNRGDTVVLTLNSVDPASTTHNWFIDLNNDKTQQATEPHSNDTASSTRYTYTVTLNPGTYTYRCQYHFTMMFGNITVRASAGGGTTTGIDTTLVIGGVIIVVAIVAVVSAVMLRRKRP